jgi:Tol biopolymer transport system component
LTQENATDQQPSISRDGKRLAFCSNRSGGNQVYVKDLDSAPEIPLTFGAPGKFAVSISPDGSRVVYAVNDGARMPVYMVPAEGGAAERICSDCGYNLSWSPDGGTLFYVIRVSGRIASLDLKSRRSTVVAQHEQYRLYQPQLSPDGRWLAFEALSSANCRIYVTPFQPGEPVPESQWVSMTDNPVWDRKPRWSPDGRLLYFLSERDGFRCLWARPFVAASRSPSGPVFAVYHSHLARLSMLNLNLSALETAVVPGRFVFNMADRAGNIWMADFPH